MAFYTGSKSAAFNTAADFLTATAAAARRMLIHECSVSGEGTASASNVLGVSRVGTLGVTPTALTPDKVELDSAAAALTMATAFATAPVLSGGFLLRLGCNANGGVYRWVAKPGEEITFRDTAATGQCSFRPISGTSTMSVHIVVEEQ